MKELEQAQKDEIKRKMIENIGKGLITATNEQQDIIEHNKELQKLKNQGNNLFERLANADYKEKKPTNHIFSKANKNDEGSVDESPRKLMEGGDIDDTNNLQASKSLFPDSNSSRQIDVFK